MRIILASAFVLISTLAHAGTFTITITSSAVGGSVTKSVTIADADLTRFVNAEKLLYPAMDANGNPETPTTAQALTSWFNGIVQGTITNVLNVEKQNAVNNAINGVTPIQAQ